MELPSATLSATSRARKTSSLTFERLPSGELDLEELELLFSTSFRFNRWEDVGHRQEFN